MTKKQIFDGEEIRAPKPDANLGEIDHQIDGTEVNVFNLASLQEQVGNRNARHILAQSINSQNFLRPIVSIRETQVVKRADSKNRVIQRQPPPTPARRDGQRREVTLPGVRRLTPRERAILDAAMIGSGMFTATETLKWYAYRVAAKTLGVTIADGLSFSAGTAMGGGALSRGIYFGPKGEIGMWGSGAINEGVMAGFSLTRQLTIVVGGPRNLDGPCFAVGGSAGLGPVVGLAILLKTNGDPLGISVEAGLGAGIEAFGTILQTWARDPEVIAPPIGLE